jgi:hypothetical protein
MTRCGRHSLLHLINVHDYIPPEEVLWGLTKENPDMTPEQIKTICMVCGVLVRGDPNAPFTSHGYCKPCGQKVLEDMKKLLEEEKKRKEEEKKKKKDNPDPIDEAMASFGFVRHPERPGHWIEPSTGIIVRHRNVVRWAKESPDLRRRIKEELGKFLRKK